MDTKPFAAVDYSGAGDDRSAVTSSEFASEKSGPTKIRMLLAQIVAVIIFMCGLVGAFYYAIETAESSEAEKRAIDWGSMSHNYSALFNQYSPIGKLTITLASTNKSVPRQVLESYSYWYQDDEKGKIVHKFDFSTVAYVYPEVTYWVRLDDNGAEIKCIQQSESVGGGYFNYIYRLGLFQMEDRHSAFQRMNQDLQYFIFDSQPQSIDLSFEVIELNYKMGEPILVQAFVDSRTGLFLGWQTYFTNPFLVRDSKTESSDTASDNDNTIQDQTPQLSIQSRVYSFPKMESLSSIIDFPSLPTICNSKNKNS